MTAVKARYIMVGGFLGAGKTTSILRLAEWLTVRGLRVGLVTNDQGGGLVDTALAAAHRMPVEEIVKSMEDIVFRLGLDAFAELVGQFPDEVEGIHAGVAHKGHLELVWRKPLDHRLTEHALAAPVVAGNQGHGLLGLN